MSRDDLIKHAQTDTPEYVQVPPNMYGVALWMLGRFGVAVVFAASTFYVYQDMRADRAELFSAYKSNIEVIRDFKNILENQSRTLDKLSEKHP